MFIGLGGIPLKGSSMSKIQKPKIKWAKKLSQPHGARKPFLWPRKEPKHLHQIRPQLVFTITIFAIFIAEVFAMGVIYFAPPMPYWLSTLLDVTVMITIIYPVIYFLLFRSLLVQIDERRRGEALLAKVLEILPVGIWITDENGRIVRGNPASLHIWGGVRYVGPDEYGHYKGWWANNGKPIQPEEWACTRAISHLETTLDEEIEIESFDGAHKIILNSALPILDEENVLQGAIVINQDITRRRQMERALIQTNELLERFFLNIHTLIAYMDRDFNFIRVNEAYARAGGHPPEYFIGKNHFDLYPHDENRSIFQQVIETGEPYSVIEKAFEYAEFPERGVTYWDWSLQPVRSAQGMIDGVVLSLVDATERVQAKMQLAKQNRELRQLSEAERAQREFTESLNKATLALNSDLDLEHVLHVIFDQIRKIVPFAGADIAFIEGKSLVIVDFLGFENYPQGAERREKILLLEDYPLFQRVYYSLQPLWIDSWVDDPDWRTIPGLEWVNAYAALPLVIKGEVIGIINLYSPTRSAFTQEVMDRLKALAIPAALALHNAQLYESEQAARQTAETLSTAARNLSQKLSLEHVAKTLFDHIHCLVPSDVCGIRLLGDHDHASLHLAYGYGKWADADPIPSFQLGDVSEITNSVLQRLMVDRRSLFFSSGISDVIFGGSTGSSPLQSWLLVPLVESEKLIGYVELGNDSAEPYTRVQIQRIQALCDLASVAIINAHLYEQVRSNHERLQALTRKLVDIQENERYSIARELHDEAGQSLSSLKISLGRLEQNPECPQEARQQLSDLKGAIDSILDGLHRLAMGLRPAALDHLGLVVALEQYARQLNSERLSVQFKAVGLRGYRLSREVETSLYRIVQEALTNVVRHAKASTVGILLKQDLNKLKVFIEDDGIGLDPEQAYRMDSMGLIGMRERAEMLGGSLTIESIPGKGTSIIVEVPHVDSYSDR